MGDCLGTLGAAGTGLDMDAALRRVAIVKPGPHWRKNLSRIPFSGRPSRSSAINTIEHQSKTPSHSINSKLLLVEAF